MQIKEDNLIKIGNRPMVLLPLNHWNAISEKLLELEEALRFSVAYETSRSEKGITLKELQKKYKLK